MPFDSAPVDRAVRLAQGWPFDSAPANRLGRLAQHTGARAVVVAMCACCAGASAQDHPEPLDSTSVERFADDFFPREMSRRRIPGAVFVFVSSGEIAIARGYGAAQLEPRRPVDPERTRFRLASVSKTITATAALQLVESGRLDLHRSVTSYLTQIHLDEARGAVTLHHLLTHTPGFDERLTGMAARSADAVSPLADYLAQSMPPSFIGPGRVISYSNHGFGLVGLLVQEASGRPFADYVRERVFEPLGMLRSGALEGAVPADLATAYDIAGGRHRPLSPEYIQATPAGAFYSTGTDMGRFLIAHLRGGAYRGGRVLRPETVAMMHAQHFAQAAGVPGWAYGMWEDTRNGRRALLHNGGGKGYRAVIYLLPDSDAGFFVAYNLADRHVEGELQEVFITRFRERFLPARAGADAGATAAGVDPVEGEYVYVRRARTTAESFISIVNHVRVNRGRNGALTIAGFTGGPIELRPVAPSVYRRADGRGTVAFEAAAPDSPPRLLMIAGSGFPAVFERVPLAATVRVQLIWLSGMVIAMLYAAARRPLASVWRRAARHDTSRSWRLSTDAAASTLNLIFLIGFPVAFLGKSEGGFPEFAYGVPAAARALLLVPPVTAVLAVASLIGSIIDPRSSSPRRPVRLASLAQDGPPVANLLVVAALLSFTAFAWYWNLLPVPGIR